MTRALLVILLCGCADEKAKLGGETPGPVNVDVSTIGGDITWQVRFDADAEAIGLADCDYSRHYVGTEDRSSPWLCPECEVVFVNDVEMTSGRECYDLISDNSPEIREWLGYGAGTWYRGGALNYRLSNQGSVDIQGSDLTTTYTSEAYEHPDGGTFELVVSGELTLGEDRSDPFHGLTAPPTYDCGWPKADPREFEGEYVFEVGSILPDGVFLDRCEDPVRLHDFKGNYLVISISALDCPPCQDMASEEAAFIAMMRSLGYSVEAITLLAPTLAAPLEFTSRSTLAAWIDEFDLESPVLADRGWGFWMSADALGDGFGYPTTITVRPDLKVIDVRSGFGDWTPWQQIIAED